MKKSEFTQMIIDSITKRGGSTKGEYTKDVIETAIKEGRNTLKFMMYLPNIGWVCQDLKKKKVVKISKSNKCDCGRCEAGTISGLHDDEFIWSIA